MKFNLIATSTFGIEGILANELKALGFEDLIVENGLVKFKGDEEDLCRANMWLRTAERIFIEVGTFKALTFESLFDQIHQMPWELFCL